MAKLKNYQPIIKEYSYLFRQPPLLNLEDDPATGGKVVKITLYFIPSFYGDTKMRIREWFDKEGNFYRYRYCWEKNKKPEGHICAWENEHNHGVETDPHHHHHVPGDRKKVTANHHVRSLTNALEIVKNHIDINIEYEYEE